MFFILDFFFNSEVCIHTIAIQNIKSTYRFTRPTLKMCKESPMIGDVNLAYAETIVVVFIEKAPTRKTLFNFSAKLFFTIFVVKSNLYL